MTRRKPFIPGAPLLVRVITPWLEVAAPVLSILPLPVNVPHHLKGAIGEVFARRHLRRKGFFIWQKNWRGNSGEIDVVAIKNGMLVFVEIKTRVAVPGSIYGPLEAVTPAKRENIKTLAHEFLREYEPQIRVRRLKEIRFDLIGVYYPFQIGGRISLEHIEAAFDYDE